jgi:hypothetical protein
MDGVLREVIRSLAPFMMEEFGGKNLKPFPGAPRPE